MLLVLGIWFVALALLFWMSRNRLNAYVRTLPPDLAAGLPERRSFLGPFRFERVIGAVLDLPAADAEAEQLRIRAVWWRRNWIFLAWALGLPVLALNALFGAAIGAGIEYSQVDPDSLGVRAALVAIGEAALLIGALRLPRPIRRRTLVVYAALAVLTATVILPRTLS